MARQIKSVDAVALLTEVFPMAEDDYRDNTEVAVPAEIIESTETLFASITQAYREALVGCAVARILDPDIDIRYPATEDGDNAFSGRSLADKVVTPFLRDRSIPISASPYLSALRGGAKFIPGGAPRIQRDKVGFNALVTVVEYLRELDEDEVRKYLRYLFRGFIHLREASKVPLKKIAKPNLEQLGLLINGLLSVKSGGRLPALLTTAMFQTLSECHGLKWEVEFQGINVADKASGAVGDLTIKKGGVIILGVEVTERPIDQGRVTLVFNQKVSPSGLLDYLFVTTAEPHFEAREAARSYTAVGHEMNFVQLDDWLINNLASIGPGCRAIFQDKVLDLLSVQSADLKVAWNDQMDLAIGIKPA